jgi:hypothetical protein
MVVNENVPQDSVIEWGQWEIANKTHAVLRHPCEQAPLIQSL